MPKTLIALPLLLCASSAFAQPAPQLPPELTDPATVHQLAGTLDSLSRALMNVRVGEAKAAIEGRDATPQERRMTVGDYARRNDPDFDRHMHQQIASIEPQVQRSVKAMNRALPALMQALDDAQHSLERAVANMPDPTYPRR